jgi:hypothetical protein
MTTTPMTPEQARELGEKLVTLSTAARLGGKLDWNQHGALSIASSLLHVLNNHAVIREQSFDCDRHEHFDHHGDLLSATVKATHHTFTITI